MPYSNGSLDRGVSYRRDPLLLVQVFQDPNTILIPMWRDQFFMVKEVPIQVSVLALNAKAILSMALNAVFLGHDDDSGMIAVDLSAYEEADACELVQADSTMDLRHFFWSLSPEDASMYAYARGILHWHRNQRFCGCCGSISEILEGGHVRKCMNNECGKLLFPRIEPAVICLVESEKFPKRVLLGRHKGAPEGVFSSLAGFVEIGESLEDAVKREIREEAGIDVDQVIYQASQPWPFPSGLMVGFRATARDEKVVIDPLELEEARWFSREELIEKIAQDEIRNQGKKLFKDSIGRKLIENWLNHTES